MESVGASPFSVSTIIMGAAMLMSIVISLVFQLSAEGRERVVFMGTALNSLVTMANFVVSWLSPTLELPRRMR